ncbi:PAS domain S-box protein [Sulfuricurvum sp.]|uniref:PAS domain-containing protein n=1 Tax=Sulfuricurvum sp. TaxID=2025608 RepID=UPI002E354AF6|nr:PAS domain S-box protein [Sulfuricurvum sp.]HEX5329725.1 PAS domain S-box protein [Sulfuricurvum sp.]
MLPFDSSFVDHELFREGPVVIFVWKNEAGWPVETVSRNLHKLYGYMPDEYTSGKLMYADQIHPDDIAQVAFEVEKAGSCSECSSFDHKPYRYRDEKGDYRWVKDSTRIIRDDDGTITHYIGYLVDITNEVALKEETALLKERLDLAWTATNDGLWDWIIDEDVVYFSDRWKEMIGYERDEFPNESSAFFEHIHPNDRDRVQKALEEHFADPEHRLYEVDLRIQCKDGSYKWIQSRGKTSLNPDGTPHRMVGAHTDITVRRLLEEQKNNEQMRLFFERQLVGMAITSPEKGWLKTNEKLHRMLGYTHDELTHLTWEEMTYPDDLPRDLEQFDRLLRGEIDEYMIQKRFMRKDKHIVYTNLSVSCVRREDGSVDYVLALLEDITTRKQAEETINELNLTLERRIEERTIELQDALSFNEGIINAIPDLLFELNKEGTYLGIWAQNQELLAAQKEMLLGNNIRDFLATEATKSVMEAIDEADKKGLSFGKTIRINVANGERWFELSVSKNESDGAFLVLSRDITERKEAELQMSLLTYSLDALSDTILLMEENSPLFVYVNHGTCRKLGYSREQLIGGMGVFDIDPDWSPEEWAEFWPRLQAQRVMHFESRHRTKEGRIFPVDVTSHYVEYEDKVYNLAICREIVGR